MCKRERFALIGYIAGAVSKRELWGYLALLLAAISILFSLPLLGDQIEVTWWLADYYHVRLRASLLGAETDLAVWIASVSLCYLILPLATYVKRARFDFAMIITVGILPLVSLGFGLIFPWKAIAVGIAASYAVVYLLVARSDLLLGIPTQRAARVVSAILLTTLALVGVSGALSLLLWSKEPLEAILAPSFAVEDPAKHLLSRLLYLNIELLYLAQPFLPTMMLVIPLISLGLLAWWILRHPLQRVLRSRPTNDPATDSPPLPIEKRSHPFAPTSEVVVAGAIMLLGSILAVFLSSYPYCFLRADRVVGSDAWWYLQVLENLRAPLSASDFMRVLTLDRGLLYILLYAVRELAQLPNPDVIKSVPFILTILLQVTTFALVKEGTRSTLTASLAGLLAVLSVQTTMGMSAAILANWLSLSFANLTFALVLRASRKPSPSAFLGASASGFLALLSHPFTWAAIMLILTLYSVAEIMAKGARSWKETLSEGRCSAVVVVSNISVVVAGLLDLGVIRELSFTVQAYWNHAQAMLRNVLSVSPTEMVKWTLFVGRNRLDFPLLTLLTIAGLILLLAAHRSANVFGRLLASMMIVPVSFALILGSRQTGPWTIEWRGFYLLQQQIPAALTIGALLAICMGGAVGRTNRALSIICSLSMITYIVLSFLTYSLLAILFIA